MFPLVDRDGLTKPVIQIIGEEAIDSGIEEICIITAPGEESLYRDYFRRLDDDMVKAFRGKDWAILESRKLQAFGERLHFAEQNSPEGFGHAVYQLHLFGVIRGAPIDPAKGVYKSELIIEKPAVEVAREKLVTPGLPAGNFLAHFGMHVFSPRIFDSLEYLIKNNIREKGEIQLTDAQEHLRQQTDKYWAVVTQGQRYDTGIPYGLMETQLALALCGIHRTEICEAIARILAMQVKS